MYVVLSQHFSMCVYNKNARFKKKKKNPFIFLIYFFKGACRITTEVFGSAKVLHHLIRAVLVLP